MPSSVERWCWAAMVALAPWVPAAALAAAGLLWVAGWRARRRDDPGPWHRGRAWRRFGRAFPAPVVVGVLALAAYHVTVLAAWVDLLGYLVLSVILAVVAPAPGEGVRRAALRDGVLLGGLALVAVQSVAVVLDTIGGPSGAAGRMAGTMAHANLLAPSMLLAAAALALLADGADGPRRRWAVLGLVFALALALASGSRAAVLGAVAGSAIWALWALGRPAGAGRGAGPDAARSGARRWGAGRRRLAWLVLGTAVLAPVAVSLVRGLPVEGLLVREVERSVVFATALDIVAERPVLGQGGVPWAVLVDRVEPARPAGALPHAHSVPLHLAARGGAVGLLLAVLLALGSYRVLRPHLANVLSRPGIGPPVLAAALAAVALQAFVDLVVIDPAVYLLAAALVGTVTVVAQGYHPDA